MSLKILHIGLCVQPEPINGFQQAFIDVVGRENYMEVSCGDPNVNEKAVLMFDTFRPDIVFMQIQTEGVIKKETFEHFKESKVINWTGDIRNETPRWMCEVASYCISAFSNMRDVRFMREGGFKSEYLEIGYDPEIYCPQGEKLGNSEIVFMANNYSDMFPLGTFRMGIVKTLNSAFGSKFSVYGNGWPTGISLNHSQTEEAKYYRGAKIAINCSNFKVERYSSDRLLRILGSGCFCLSHKWPGMDYVDGVHLATFDNMNDLISKLNFYLCHEEERKKIAKAGQELVLQRNTFKHQVQNIIKIAE